MKAERRGMNPHRRLEEKEESKKKLFYRSQGRRVFQREGSIQHIGTLVGTQMKYEKCVLNLEVICKLNENWIKTEEDVV